ncbi:hypothetical protein [Kribbella sp. CA-247076]|uniref:hypothetical protein n=1 Tax=Kribbella sp. CA-247076 TaxID=3239941 RepID=UPI003D8C850F
MNNLNDTLPDLMRRATEHLEPPSTDLVERGMRHGVTLRRRRIAVRGLTGATAVLATLGVIVGGTQVFGSGEPAGEAPAAGPATASAVAKVGAVTQKETLETLLALLPPDLKVGQEQTWGFPGFNGAAVVVDDGKGPSKLSIAVSADGQDGTCVDPQPGTCVRRPDGSLITVSAKEPTYGEGNPGGVVRNSVLVTRAGVGSISLISFNAAEEKGVDKSRAEPALSVTALTALADDQAWRFPAKQPIPSSNPAKPEPKSPGAGKPAVPVQQTLQTLRNVLPKGLTVTRPQTWGGGSEGHNGAAFVIDDGKGLSRIDAFLTYEQPVTKCGPEGIPNCRVRPDGSVVGWVKNEPVYADARQKVNGVVSSRVEIHYPDGRMISMTSYNGPQEKDARHTRPKPAFSTDQLLQMAGSKSWAFPGTK